MTSMQKTRRNKIKYEVGYFYAHFKKFEYVSAWKINVQILIL